ncbi:MAG: N-acetylmuramidase family protein, partial [Candidatus Rokubacteria bacterium]|nr:N-acetylmuramidase family protein [Candidatus Rokubacteria bacterium]
MAEPFRGDALPLDREGLAEVIDRLRVGAAELWAVLNVETRGCGFLPDRRPAMLFERHIFSRETDHRFDTSHPDVSNHLAGGYGAGGAAQYERLQRALALDRRAALRSASWGIGQLMGFNAEIAGYDDVEAMVTAMTASENQQLLGMAGEITHNGLDRALRAHDWAAFARGYNGSEYARNQYDTRLA